MLSGTLFQTIGRARVAVLGVAMLLVPISECLAQAEWQRTVKVIAPIEENTPTRALTDSVVGMAENQDLQLRRTPDAEQTASLEEIKSALSEDGLALTSATDVFITYRFILKGSRLQRDILDLHFIYRPSAEQGEDIPILYLDLTENDLYQQLLVEKGLPSSVNEVAFQPFEEAVAFHSLQEEARVVQVGNQIIRDAEQAASEKRQIAGTIRELTYD